MIHALLRTVLVLSAVGLAAPAVQAQTAPVGSWVSRADSPVEIVGSGYAVSGAALYCFGDNIDWNVGPGTTAYRYDPATDTYLRLANLPMQAYGNCGAAAGGAVYSFGSMFLPYPPGTGIGYVPDAILRYDIASNVWTLLPERVTRHGVWSSTAKIGSRIFLIGGYDNSVPGFVPGAVSEFDPESGTLTARADMPLPSSWHTAAGSDETGRAYVFGAWDPADDSSRRSFEYDPGADAWTEIPPVTSGGVPVTRGLAAAFEFGGKLYVTGGYGDVDTTSSCLEYDPDLQSWRDVASMTVARLWHAAGVIGGKAYVVGGFGDPGQPNPSFSCEEFSPPDFGAAPSAVVEQRVGAQAVPQGGSVYGIVRFAAQVDDPDAGQLVRFQVQVKPASAPDWTGAISMDSGFVSAGLLTHDWYVPTLGGYDWRWRVMDDVGNFAGGSSSWIDFEDPLVSPDFVRTNPPSPPSSGGSDSGGGKCGGSATGGTGALGLLAILILVAGVRR